MQLQQLPRPDLQQDVLSSALNFGKAVLILLLGWIVALILKNVIRGILKKTQIDNQIANWIGGQTQGENYPIEDWIANIVYWIVLLFAVVAFLSALRLEAVSQPLNTLLEQITRFIPQLLGAVALLGLAWLLATLTRLVVTRVLQQFRVDERLGQAEEGTPQANQISLSETIGNALYWFIFLLFLPSILSTLQLEGTLVPVQQLLNEILAILPNILAAVIIGGVGWIIAQIIRRVVTNLLRATGVDQVGARFGLSPTAIGQGQSLSQILGSIVYVLVLIPIAIVALDALQITAISAPATDMLNQILAVLPKLFSAVVILVLAYIGGQYLAQLLSGILASIGFDNIFQWLGITAPSPARPQTPPPTATSPPPSASPYSPEEPDTLLLDTEPTPSMGLSGRTPSDIVGIVILVAVMLVASLTAVDILEIEALKTLVGVILAIAGQVLVGVVVFAVGLYFANLAFNLIVSPHSRQSKFLAHTARIAIIVLVSAMALQQMGIAPNIVNLAFGLLVGGISVAIALAFGLGGREVAGEQLREWVSTFKREN